MTSQTETTHQGDKPKQAKQTESKNTPSPPGEDPQSKRDKAIEDQEKKAEEEERCEIVEIRRRKARKQTKHEPDHAYRAFEYHYMRGSERNFKDTIKWINERIDKPVSSRTIYGWSSDFGWEARIRRREERIKSKIEDKIINTDVERQVRLLGVARDLQEEGLDVMYRKSKNAQFKDGVAAVKAGTELEVKLTDKLGGKGTEGDEFLNECRSILAEASNQKQITEAREKEAKEEKEKQEKERQEKETKEKEEKEKETNEAFGPGAITVAQQVGAEERRKQMKTIQSV